MFKILSIDGGGIRGAIAAHWLDVMQHQMQTPLSQCFDLVAGTSTGSILAAAVAYEMVGCTDGKLYTRFYQEYGKKIFPRARYFPTWERAREFVRPTYDLDNLQNALIQEFGKERKLKNARTNLFIPSYETVTRQPFYFKSYAPLTENFKVWEACLASCAAPTYFPASELKMGSAEKCLIDGGTVANNPSALALAEAVSLLKAESVIDVFKGNDSIMLVSLGTGNLIRPIKKEQAQNWGDLQWARPFIDVVFDGTNVANHLICQKVLPKSLYFRFQVELKGANDDLDDASEDNIQSLINLAGGCINRDDSKEFSQVINILKATTRKLS